MKLSLNMQFITPNGTPVIISGLGRGVVTVASPNSGIVRRPYQNFLVDVSSGLLKVSE